MRRVTLEDVITGLPAQLPSTCSPCLHILLTEISDF